MNQEESVQKILDVLTGISRENDGKSYSFAPLTTEIEELSNETIVKITKGWLGSSAIEKLTREFDHVVFTDGQLWVWNR